MAIIAAAATIAAGQIQAGREASAEGASAERIAQYNAALKDREATALRQRASFEQKRQAEAAARTKSSLLARLAASGTVPDAGTSLLLQTEQAAELELENLLIGYGGETMAQRAEYEAVGLRKEGELAKRRGKSARKASYFQAGSTLLTGFALSGGGGGNTGRTMTSSNVRYQSSLSPSSSTIWGGGTYR